MNVRVAVVQAAPVVLDAGASVEKACGLIAEAAAAGARLILLPEAFVPLFPSSCWAHACARWAPEATELFLRLHDQAVEIPGPHTERLGEAARAAGAWVAIGVNERSAARAGTLWNTLLVLSPQGEVAIRHRKLLPTMQERVFWGQGRGDDLIVAETGFGRVGGLLCWENFMPAARRRLHLAGVDFYLAPTADDRELWAASMRAFAFEAGAFVLSSCQYLRRDDFPDDFPLRAQLEACPEVLIPGGSVIVDPHGAVLEGPVRGREEILIADCDRDAIVAARRVFDVAGHYERPDIGF
ncbi:MAG: nitrilase [Miltoncostaeaceae bacterium]|nr:nitrilase [Miltoncostaeaceae bacterium]